MDEERIRLIAKEVAEGVVEEKWEGIIATVIAKVKEMLESFRFKAYFVDTKTRSG